MKNRRTTTKENRSIQTYVDGNTVRRLEAAPDYRTVREEQRRQEEKRRKEQQRRNKRVARMNQEKAMQMNFGYVLFLSAAALMTAVVSVMYIQIQSDVTVRMENIAALESQVSNLRADNDAALKRINASVDLASIKDTAINQLGMVYASADQIIYYTVDNDDYMNQYEEIPSR